MSLTVSLREPVQAGVRGDGAAPPVRQCVEGPHALGNVIGEEACGRDDFIQLQVEVAEVGAHEVPVGLLSLQVQLDQVRQDQLQVAG